LEDFSNPVTVPFPPPPCFPSAGPSTTPARGPSTSGPPPASDPPLPRAASWAPGGSSSPDGPLPMP
jgi:hypothetical protein